MARHGTTWLSIARHGARRSVDLGEGVVHGGVDAEVCVEHPEFSPAHKVVGSSGSALKSLWSDEVMG